MTTGGKPNFEAILQRALALHQLARFGEAGALYEQVLRTDPRNIRALHLLGVLALQDNRTAAAAQLFERALAVDPWNFPAWSIWERLNSIWVDSRRPWPFTTGHCH